MSISDHSKLDMKTSGAFKRGPMLFAGRHDKSSLIVTCKYVLTHPSSVDTIVPGKLSRIRGALFNEIVNEESLMRGFAY
jgi:hypothetical protein